MTKRIYGVWPGNPVFQQGLEEDTIRCIETVYGDWVSYQCSRKRGYGPGGLYCKQHAKKHVKLEKY